MIRAPRVGEEVGLQQAVRKAYKSTRLSRVATKYDPVRQSFTKLMKPLSTDLEFFITQRNTRDECTLLLLKSTTQVTALKKKVSMILGR